MTNSTDIRVVILTAEASLGQERKDGALRNHPSRIREMIFLAFTRVHFAADLGVTVALSNSLGRVDLDSPFLCPRQLQPTIIRSLSF